MLCEDIEIRIPKINKNLDELDTQEELEKKPKDKKKEKNKQRREKNYMSVNGDVSEQIVSID